MTRSRTALVAISCAFSLAPFGCGGGGGGGSAGGQQNLSMMTASGKVVLPAGFKESLTGMKVQSGIDTEPVAANGTFQVHVVGPGEVPLYLQDSSGNTILMGFADGGSSGSPEAGGNGLISATKTAEALMFYGLSGPTVPAPYWNLFLADIASSPQITQLASTISARVVANPTAFANGDSQLFAAAASACTAASAGSAQIQAAEKYATSQSNAPRSQALKVTVVAQPQESGNQNLILVQPSSEQGGIEVLNSPDEPGTIQFVNHYRRRAAAFIYQTATQVSGGDLTTVSPTVLPSTNNAPLISVVSSALGLSVVGSDVYEIPPAHALNKLPASLIDLAFGNGAFTPAKSESVELPLAPGTVRTDYTIIVVGNGIDNAFIPFEDPTPAPLEKEWADAVTCLGMETAILDVFVPTIASQPFPGSPEWSSLTGNQVGEIAHIISSIPEMFSAITEGNFKEAAELLIDEVSPALTDDILSAMWTQTFFAGSFQEQLQLAEHELKGAFAALNVVNFITTVIDASAVVVANGEFDSYISWTANVVTKGARLSPPTATVSNNNPAVLLTATPGAVNDPKAPFVYVFSVSGTAGGALENALGTSAKSTTIQTTSNQVQYFVSIQAQNGQKDTVDVVVYENEGTASNPVKGAQVGSADSVITVQLGTEGPCGNVPSPITGGGVGIQVANTVIHPGDTITITVSKLGSSELSELDVPDVFVDSYTVSGPGGLSHTYPAGDPSNGVSFSLGAPFADTRTITIVTDKADTQPSCPVAPPPGGIPNQGGETGCWVVAFSGNGFSAVPIEVISSN